MTAGRARAGLVPLLFWCCGLAAAVSEPHGAAHHEPLPERAALDLATVLDAAVAGYPDAALLPARSAQAEAWRDRSASLLADAPSFSFRYQTDRFGDDAGLREYEGGLELPLWRWGERRAARSLAGAANAVAQTAGPGLRWQVAGELRQVLWAMADAEQGLVAARDALDLTAQLAAAVGRRHELGDVPLGDVLLADSAELAAQEAVVDARAALVDAQREYRVLSGLAVRPPFRTEVLSGSAGIPADHPALVVAEAELARARSRAELSRKRALGSPTLLLGPRWERPPLGDGYDDSVGLTLTVPLPGTAHGRTAAADAQAETAAALAARDRLRRALAMALHEAEHALEVARENLTTARRRAELAARHARMGRTAYEAGEIDLMDLLRLQETAVAARRARDRFDIEMSRQTAAYNQAVGVLP
ncbi:MAG: TolC family protein [Gammaproteobacteria bacterium]|nr:TolC family protein [Gammaproteobacteria bacterium]